MHRRTREEMDTLRRTIYSIAETDKPVSVRHIFYRAVVLGLVSKDDKGYQQLQKCAVELAVDKELMELRAE